MTNLVERDAQMAQLRACEALAESGTGNVALVMGEAGIGKTSLVKEFARQRKGLPLWWGACDALQTPDPLAPLHDIAPTLVVPGAGRVEELLARLPDDGIAEVVAA